MMESNLVPQPNRIFLFRVALSKCLINIAESLSKDQFMESITVLTPDVNVGEKLYKAMVKELYSGMNAEFEEMLKEGSLQMGLAKISKLLEDAAGISQEISAWRPPGDVELHLRSVDAEMIKEGTEKLKARVIELEHENEILSKEVVAKRANVSATNSLVNCTLKRAPLILKHLKKLCEEWTSSVQFLADDGPPNL